MLFEKWSKEQTKNWIVHRLKKAAAGLYISAENALAPIAGIVFDLIEAARVAQPFEEDWNPFVAKAHMLSFVRDVVAPGHGAQSVPMGNGVL
jgi:hypothetical protein